VSTEQPQEGGHKKPPIPTPAKKVPAYNIDKRGDRLYQAQTLHKWFAISSLLLFVITIGMVMQDYSREWKRYQREFNELAYESASADFWQARSAIDDTKYNALAASYNAALEAQKQNSGAITEAEEKVAALNAQFIRVDQLYKSTKAQWDEDKYAYDEAVARNSPDLPKRKATSEATEKATDDYFRDREEITTQLEAAKAEVTKLQNQSIEDRKQILAMRSDLDRIGRQLNTLKPGAFVTAIINAPMLDFLKPSLQVKQILLPNLFYDQPFTQISRVDRCTTCHLGIDNEKFQDAAQPFRTHPNLDLFLKASSAHPLDKVGCTSCHGGLDRATDFLTAGHTPNDETQREDWEFKYGWHHDAPVRHYLETPMYPKSNTEAGCYKCHNSSPDVPRAASLGSGRELIKQFGCHGCHRIPGYEGIRKVGPDLATISTKLTQDWTKKWLANPKDFKSEARMPKFWYNTNNSGVQNGVDWDKRNPVEINAIVAYLWDESSKLTAKTLPAKNTNGSATRGKELIETIGCYGCHSIGPIEEAPNQTQIRRRHGYNLANQGSKVTATWLANWVQDPQKVWPDSKMPSLRLTDSETADITAYLSSLKNPAFDAKVPPPTDAKVLDDVVLEFKRGTMTEAKARAELATMSPEQKNLYAGEQLIGRYGCYGCHNIPGFETAQPIGTELTEAGSKILSQLDFGFLDIEHERSEWYEAKLHDPRIFDKGRVKRPEELLRMPDFGLDDKDVHSIVMVLNSMVKDKVPLEMKERPDPDVAEGRMLVSEKNCKGCHIIEGLGGDIRATIPETVQWPPNLNTQGHKTQPEWLRAFLKDPEAEKPRWWMDTRMPTFHFTERQIAAIGKYFARLDKVDWGWIDTEVQTTQASLQAGKQLFDELQCMNCHPTSNSTAGTKGLAPKLTLAAERLRPDWVVRWIQFPTGIVPDTSMPTFFPMDERTGKRRPHLPLDPSKPPILGGDAEAQIRALRDHIYTLGSGRVTTTGN
jgi:cytochrome c2/mono/diheme cytochrome c family protein